MTTKILVTGDDKGRPVAVLAADTRYLLASLTLEQLDAITSALEMGAFNAEMYLGRMTSYEDHRLIEEYRGKRDGMRAGAKLLIAEHSAARSSRTSHELERGER